MEFTICNTCFQILEEVDNFIIEHSLKAKYDYWDFFHFYVRGYSILFSARNPKQKIKYGTVSAVSGYGAERERATVFCFLLVFKSKK